MNKIYKKKSQALDNKIFLKIPSINNKIFKKKWTEVDYNEPMDQHGPIATELDQK